MTRTVQILPSRPSHDPTSSLQRGTLGPACPQASSEPVSVPAAWPRTGQGLRWAAVARGLCSSTLSSGHSWVECPGAQNMYPHWTTWACHWPQGSAGRVGDPGPGWASFLQGEGAGAGTEGGQAGFISSPGHPAWHPKCHALPSHPCVVTVFYPTSQMERQKLRRDLSQVTWQ